MPCPKGIQSVTQPHANVYICGKNRCAQLHGLHDWQILTVSVFLNEAIASPMSEDCCHDASVSNMYVAAWQEIVKPAKVLRMFYCLFNYSLCRTQQRSDRPGFMRKTCFSPFKPYLQLRGTLLSNIYAVEMHPWQKCYCSWSEN